MCFYGEREPRTTSIKGSAHCDIITYNKNIELGGYLVRVQHYHQPVAGNGFREASGHNDALHFHSEQVIYIHSGCALYLEM